MTRQATAQAPQPTTHPLSQGGILQRKCTACGQHKTGGGTCAKCQGNRAKTSTPALPVIQTKLTVGAPNDKYEQEADRVAERIMRMPAPESQAEMGMRWSKTGPQGPSQQPRIQRKCAQCDDEQRLQMKENPGVTPEVTPAIASRIQSLQGGGQPLPASTRNFFEPRFGQDFSNVRVHTDESARSLEARAYTVGHSIVFGSGQYSPETNTGRKLLAHELTHVVQQGYADQIANTIQSSQASFDAALSTSSSSIPSIKAHPDSPMTVISRADPDAVSRVFALGRTIGSGVQFWPTNVTDTRVGPISVQGGLLSSGASRLNVIIGENLTPRTLARQLLPLWITATPFTPPGAATPSPLVPIDEEILARGLLVYNQYYLPVPAMTKWQSGLRFPLPVEIDEGTGIATLHPAIIRNLANAFDPTWTPLLDMRVAMTNPPPAATLTADVTAFLAQETSALSRGIHLGARAVTNALAERPFIREAFRQLGAASFDVALAFVDHLVNHEIQLLAAQRDGATILAEIQAALGAAPSSITAAQQASLDRANLMLGLVVGAAAEAPPTATRTRPDKAVTVDTLKLVGSNHNPATHIAVADAIYSQCNVRIRPGVTADDSAASAPQTTTWLGGDTTLSAAATCGSTTSEERTMWQGAISTYGFSAPIRAFFVENTMASGYSFPPFCATGAASPYRGFAAIDNSGNTDTLAHEIGHILINHGGHPASTLMGVRPRTTLRLTDWQCNRIYSNA